MIKGNYNVKQIPTGVWKQNCYIVYDNSQNGILIDPGADAEIIDEFIVKNKIKLQAICNTHGHYDHIGAVCYFKKKYLIPFYLHSCDEKLSKSANLYVKIFESQKFIEVPKIDYFIDNIESPIKIESFELNYIHSAGHTMGSVCFKIGNQLFTGDTILPDQVGRTDLPGGNKDMLIKSLEILLKLPNDIIIYPGHGKISTLLKEIKHIEEYINFHAP